MKGEEDQPNEREKEDVGDERKPDLWSVFERDPPRGGQRPSALGSEDVNDPSALDLDSHLSLNSHSALDSHSHRTEQDMTNSTGHDLTALPPPNTHNPPRNPGPT